MKMRRWPRREFIRFLLFAGFIVILFIGQIIVSRREPRFVRIHEINPLLNFWTVRVEGRLQSDTRLLKSGSLFYLVNDGTGSLAVFDQRVEGSGLLKAGSPVSVVGTLQVGAGNNRRLQVRQLVVYPSGDGGGLADIHTGMAGERVSITGRVVRAWVPESGSRAPYKIVLEDRGTEIDVVHWLSGAPEILVGDDVAVSGRVGQYRNDLQVKVSRSSDLQVLNAGE
jgi:hypothetical protein